MKNVSQVNSENVQTLQDDCQVALENDDGSNVKPQKESVTSGAKGDWIKCLSSLCVALACNELNHLSN